MMIELTELNKIHKNKEALESFLFEETFRRDLDSYEFVNYDLSTSYFIGIKCNLSEFGRSKDDKGGRTRQVILALMINDKGYPFKWDVLPGNTAEVKTLKNNINACVHRFGLRRISLVFDRGIVSDDNMELIDKKSLKYISALDKDQIPKITGKKFKIFSSLSPKNIAPQIEALPGFRKFDEHLYFKDLGELFDRRYILGINPKLFINERKRRQEKIRFFLKFLQEKNRELREAKKDRDKGFTERRVMDKLRGLKIRKFFKKYIFLNQNLFLFYEILRDSRKSQPYNHFHSLFLLFPAELDSYQKKLNGCADQLFQSFFLLFYSKRIH